MKKKMEGRRMRKREDGDKEKRKRENGKKACL